ncbi:NINE protein, partial [Klebsiella pneumoniae]|uniref:NINE protein n=1 Tax=Klebsiella pneumoniae TaxID=573 RepID=UPI0013D313D7
MTSVAQGQTVFCRACGKQLHMTATACPACGAPQQSSGEASRKILPAFLLCWFLGWLGLHRFYVGKVGTGILF